MQRIEPSTRNLYPETTKNTIIHQPSYKLSSQIYITQCHKAYRVYLANKKYRKIKGRKKNK